MVAPSGMMDGMVGAIRGRLDASGFSHVPIMSYAAKYAGALEAPMPGRVTAVKAEPGQRVERGEELLVVEAMKMENALRAPRGGVVRAVHVTAGEMVAPGRPLVEIEAEG